VFSGYKSKQWQDKGVIAKRKHNLVSKNQLKKEQGDISKSSKITRRPRKLILTYLLT
jgi:hypothetical protein